MKLTLETPTKLYIDELTVHQLSEVRESLTYRDKKVQFELQKFKSNPWFAQKNGEEAYQEKLKELKSQEKVCLLNKEGDRYWVLSGYRQYLEKKYGIQTNTKVLYLEPKLIPWAVTPTKVPYPYQVRAKEALLKAKHARIEFATGVGKSVIAIHLVKDLGLKTVIMTPSTSISDQLYRELLECFGKQFVGAYYNGQKEFKKRIVVGNGQSLTRVVEGTEAWNELSQAQVLIADESHTTPAATLDRVCTGLLSGAPYRFFLSATQMRNDGSDKLLDAITGPTVDTMTVREGVDQGYLAKPVFRMIRTRSDSNFDSSDVNTMTRKHLYGNPIVARQAAEIINLSVEKLGHQVLVLIDEVTQFSLLRPLLNHPVGFAHGPLTATTFHANGRVKTKGNKEFVPEEYRDSDPNQLVRQFNNGDLPILVGTSCISTGTDIRNVKTMVYLKGGKSEVEVKQGVGRCTRKVPGKTACTIVDFDVTNIDILSKHARARMKIYEDIYPGVEIVNWGNYEK